MLGTTTHSHPLHKPKTSLKQIPLRQGSDPFHQLHFDLVRNPSCFGLTTTTNYSTYLFLVATSGKLTDWIGLPTVLHLSSQSSNPGSHKQKYLTKQNLSVSSAPTPDPLSHEQNSSQHAMILKLNLMQPPQNIKR
jgi:hypothetical protein